MREAGRCLPHDSQKSCRSTRCRWRSSDAIVGSIGVFVDAKDEGAARFYSKYEFVTVIAERWPRRMYLPIESPGVGHHQNVLIHDMSTRERSAE